MKLEIGAKKNHRYRKNPASREHFRQLSHDNNAARPKQHFLGLGPDGKSLGWTRLDLAAIRGLKALTREY